MSWLGLFYLMIAVGQIAAVVWMWRTLVEIRGYRDAWRGFLDVQRKHEIDIRYLRELVNPMARSGRAPLPKHLRQENL